MCRVIERQPLEIARQRMELVDESKLNENQILIPSKIQKIFFGNFRGCLHRGVIQLDTLKHLNWL